jgi:serralysin
MRRILTVMSAVAALGIVAVPAASAKPVAPKPTIVSTVVALSGASGFDANHDDFDILREAVIATGLAPALSSRGQYTVFAPTDRAFLDLTGTDNEADAFAAVAALGLPAVKHVLLYHVARGARTADDIVPATRVRTRQGGFITKAAGSAVLVDGARRTVPVVTPDAAIVSNGVIHVIGGVLLPFPL